MAFSADLARIEDQSRPMDLRRVMGITTIVSGRGESYWLLAGFAFYTSLGGQPAFGGTSLDD